MLSSSRRINKYTISNEFSLMLKQAHSAIIFHNHEKEWISRNDPNSLDENDYYNLYMLSRTYMRIKSPASCIFDGSGKKLKNIFPCGFNDPNHADKKHDCSCDGDAQIFRWGLRYKPSNEKYPLLFFAVTDDDEIYSSKVISPAYNTCFSAKQLLAKKSDEITQSDISAWSRDMVTTLYAADFGPHIKYNIALIHVIALKHIFKTRLNQKQQRVMGTKFEAHHTRRKTNILINEA